MDQMQAVLEDHYRIQGLKLLKASAFLYPDTISPLAEEIIKREPRSGHFVTNNFTKEGIKQIRKAKMGRKRDLEITIGMHGTPVRLARDLVKSLVAQPSIEEQQMRRRKCFTDLQPVVYIPQEYAANLSGVTDYSQLLTTTEGFQAFDMVAEEMGHFLYTQTQVLLHGETPGNIIAEGMALVDDYVLLKRACEATGVNLTDRNDPVAQVAVGGLVGKMEGRSEMMWKIMWAGGYDPTASNYSKSVSLMRGFMRHIALSETQGKDITTQLEDFHRMTGPEKARYLMHLYKEYVYGGDRDYKEYEGCASSLYYNDDSGEFEDEEAWSRHVRFDYPWVRQIGKNGKEQHHDGKSNAERKAYWRIRQNFVGGDPAEEDRSYRYWLEEFAPDPSKKPSLNPSTQGQLPAGPLSSGTKKQG